MLFSDLFGNLVTTIDTSLMENPEGWYIETSGMPCLKLVNTYGEVREGELLAYGGSFGTVEIAVRNGNAAKLTGIAPGTPVRLVRK